MREKCDKIRPKTRDVCKLSQKIQEMQAFQQILANGLKDRLYNLKGRENGRLKYFIIKGLQQHKTWKTKVKFPAGCDAFSQIL
jgi:hypothetical protein